VEHLKNLGSLLKAFDVLEEAEEAGLRVTVTDSGENLTIRGPKSAAELAKKVAECKPDVIEILQSSPGTSHAPIATAKLRRRLKKGVDWFVSIDSKLWDKDGNAINLGHTGPQKGPTKIELKVSQSLAKWLELERLLRVLYEYEGCIFGDYKGKPKLCPKDSPVRCSHCG